MDSPRLGGETCGEDLAGVNIRPVATPTRPGHSTSLHTIVQSCSIHYFTVQVSTTLHQPEGKHYIDATFLHTKHLL